MLKIHTLPDPTLRQQSVPVKNFNQNLINLVNEMQQAVIAYNGVGLAAPQIGILEQIFVINYKGKKINIINPTIIENTGSNILEERCLSCPGHIVSIKRAEKIKLETYSINGRKSNFSATGYLARIVQHELDHLSGKLIVDYQQNYVL